MKAKWLALFLLSGFLVACFCSSGFAAEEEEKIWSVGGSVDWASKYIWRGQNRSDGSVIQPSLYFRFLGFSVVPWANLVVNDTAEADQEGEFTEIHLTLDYTHEFGPVALSVGYIAYYLRDILTRTYNTHWYWAWDWDDDGVAGNPNGDPGSGDFYTYDRTDSRRNNYDDWYWSQEVYIKGKYRQEITDAAAVTLEMGAFHDFDKDNRGTFKWGPAEEPDRNRDKLADNRKQYYFAKIAGQLAASDTVEVVPSILFHYINEENAYNGWGSIIFGLAANVFVNDYVTITPFLNFSWAIDEDYFKATYYTSDVPTLIDADEWEGGETGEVRPVAVGRDAGYYKDEFWGGISVRAEY